MKKRRPTPKRRWESMRFVRFSIDDAGREIELWGNNVYTVTITPWPDHPLGVTELSIHTHTRSTRHDWREFQRIKNDIFGPEREAIELYPAESRLVDTANEYHLWVLPEGKQIPIGWDNRTVFDDSMMTDELRAQLEEATRSMGLNPAGLRFSKQRRLDA